MYLLPYRRIRQEAVMRFISSFNGPQCHRDLQFWNIELWISAVRSKRFKPRYFTKNDTIISCIKQAAWSGITDCRHYIAACLIPDSEEIYPKTATSYRRNFTTIQRHSPREICWITMNFYEIFAWNIDDLHKLFNWLKSLQLFTEISQLVLIPQVANKEEFLPCERIIRWRIG